MAPLCRIAVAQIASLPAYATQAVNFLREPFPPSVQDDGKPTLHAVRHTRGLGTLMVAVEKAHLDDLSMKLRIIMQDLARLKVRLVVFPEYAIPVECLPLLQEAATRDGCTIVAGSHTVRNTPEAAGIYNSIGLKDIATKPLDYVRKAVCPVLAPDRVGGAFFKTKRSKWEPDLVEHQDEQRPATDILVDGQRVAIVVRICIDGLTGNLPLSSPSVLCLPAASPTTEPFTGAISTALQNEIPVALANSALFGGSRIATAVQVVASAMEPFSAVENTDEAVVVMDVDLGAQFVKRGSVKTTFAAELVARLPLLYAAIPAHKAAGDFLADHRERNVLPRVADLQRMVSEDTPRALNDQMVALVSALQEGTARIEDLRRLGSAILLPPEVVPFWSRCLYAASEVSRTLNRAANEVLADTELAEAALRMTRAIKKLQGLAQDLSIVPPVLSQGTVEQDAPFLDRETEQRQLRDLLGASIAVLVRGLFGIGKTSIVAQVLKELFPRIPRANVSCVNGMAAAGIVEVLCAHLGVAREDLLDGKHLHPRTPRIVVVRNIDRVQFDEASEKETLALIKGLEGTSSRLVMTADARVDALGTLPGIELRQLGPDDLRRLFDYWCERYGVGSPVDVVPRLHGYPLAAIYAAGLLRSGVVKPFDQLKFLTGIRRAILDVLVDGLDLSEPERKAIQALSVFRRPIPFSMLGQLGLTDAEACVEGLLDRFLVEESDEGIALVEPLREHAMEEWSKSHEVRRYHEAGARYFSGQLADQSAVVRYYARSEAIYHLYSVGNFAAARNIGSDWQRDANSACDDLFRRRLFEECLAVCEEILRAKPTPFYAGRRVVCLVRLHRYKDAADQMEKLRVAGDATAWLFGAYADALISKGAPNEGLQIIEEGLKVFPTDAFMMAILAESCAGNGDNERALDLAVEALESNPNLVRAMLVASRAAKALAKFDLAFHYAKSAMRINPRKATDVYNRVVAAVRKAYNVKEPEEVFPDALSTDSGP